MQLYAEKDRNGVPVIKKTTGTAFRCVPARNEPWVLAVVFTVIGHSINVYDDDDDEPDNIAHGLDT